MTFRFHKYHGTGNDFIMVDDRDGKFPFENTEAIHRLCTRHFGIGADGLILLRGTPEDWRMVYFNSDGRESTMCGNGGRCLVAFAQSLGLDAEDFHFHAIDGPHAAKVLSDGRIELGMKDVTDIESGQGYCILDTGSPHYVSFTSGVAKMDVRKEGAEIRYSERFSEIGINVNFVEELADGKLLVRTYERGVEDETLSCGTGVTATALAYLSKTGSTDIDEVEMQTPGGKLSVRANRNSLGFTNVRLIGPTEKVFEGSLEV